MDVGLIAALCNLSGTYLHRNTRGLIDIEKLIPNIFTKDET